MAGIFYNFIIIPVYEKASMQNTLLIFIADKRNGLLFHHVKKLNNLKENEAKELLTRFKCISECIMYLVKKVRQFVTVVKVLHSSHVKN